MEINKQNNKGGYAILFAVVIVSIISMIAIGLSNTTYKQLVLSSLANDSQVAFYQADTATECALYHNNVLGTFSGIPQTLTCGKSSNGDDLSFNIATDDIDKIYKVTSYYPSTAPPCFEFDINKTDILNTVIKARGYNSCNLANPRTVEREIETTITY